MSKLIPVRYRRHKYPHGIEARIREVAGHFDIGKIAPDGDYSLHTEYSYARRKLDGVLFGGAGADQTSPSRSSSQAMV